MSALKSFFSLFLVIILLTLFSACQKGETPTGQSNEQDTVEPAGQKIDLLVLHAGSLSIPFKEIADAFKVKYPQYNVLLEGYGSRTCARQIIDLKRPVDVFGSADSEVIQNLLIPDYADYCIDFTTNEMAIMYTEKSKFADTINAQNWMDILLKPEVEYGHSDPNSDPCGYRAVLTWQLAEKHYQKENLYKNLTDKMPVKNIRPKEVDLIAMLEAGELDYIFIYRSVAEQHHAKFVVLPEEINLKSPHLADFYKTASIKVTGKQPGEFIEHVGTPMVYGLTIPKTAPQPQGALLFVEFILSPAGQDIMKRNGQPELIPPQVDHREKLPEGLKHFFQNKE